MCEHLCDSNMISAHYYKNILESIKTSDSLQDNDFNRYHDKETLFRVKPGFGRNR